MDEQTTNKERVLESIKMQMEEAFELGMKYKRLEVAAKLLPILRENEFDDLAIAKILRDAELLEDNTYANIFDSDNN